MSVMLELIKRISFVPTLFFHCFLKKKILCSPLLSYTLQLNQICLHAVVMETYCLFFTGVLLCFVDLLICTE